MRRAFKGLWDTATENGRVRGEAALVAYIFVLLAAPFIIVWFVLIGWPARLARRTPLWFGLPFGLLWFGVPAFAIVRDLLT